MCSLFREIQRKTLHIRHSSNIQMKYHEQFLSSRHSKLINLFFLIILKRSLLELYVQSKQDNTQCLGCIMYHREIQFRCQESNTLINNQMLGYQSVSL